MHKRRGVVGSRMGQDAPMLLATSQHQHPRQQCSLRHINSYNCPWLKRSGVRGSAYKSAHMKTPVPQRHQ
eukprot:353069-Chlamydomonas_euryale.AAC.28